MANSLPLKLCECPADEHSAVYTVTRHIWEALLPLADPVEILEIAADEDIAAWLSACPLDRCQHARTRELCDQIQSLLDK